MSAYKYLIGKEDFTDYKTISENIDFIKKVQPFIKEAQDMDLQPSLGYPIFYDVQNNYGTETLKINYTGLTGIFAGTEVITGKDSSDVAVATATLVSVGAGLLIVKNISRNWENAVTITGGNSSATANIDTLVFGKYYKLVNGDIYDDQYGFNIRFEGLKAALVYWSSARFFERGNEYSTATGFVTKLTPESEPISDKAIAQKALQARSGALAYYKGVEKYLHDMYIKDPSYFPLYAKTQVLQRKRGGGVRISSASKYDRENGVYNRGNNCPDDGYGA